MATQPTANARDRPYPANIQEGRVESNALPPTGSTNRELYRVRASWLVDFFPDELVIQEKTVSVIRNQLLVSFVETMPVRDVGRVIYVDTPFFAGIHILGKSPAHEMRIRGLPKKGARYAKQLLDGLLLERSGDIEVPAWLDPDVRRHRLADKGGAGALRR
jgi:hypothetical protein